MPGLDGLLSTLRRPTKVTDAPAYGEAEQPPVRSMDQDKELIAWAEKTYSLCKNERIPLERQMYVNMAFYFGRQNIASVRSAASTTGFQLITPKAPPWRVRLVINHIRRIIRTETAKLASQKPRPVVVPNTTEDEDLAAARVAEQILGAKFSQPETEKAIRSWIWWGTVCGTSFLKTYYDKHEEDENGDKGKICIERVNPFELLVSDLLEEDMEKQAFVIHVQTKTVAWVKATYGLDVQPDASAVSDVIEDQFLNMIGAQQMRKDRALILEFWLRPHAHPQFPEGGMFTIAGGKLAHVSPKPPYKHKGFPFYKFVSIPTGRFYGDSVIVDAIPIQREINRTRSQLAEARNLMSKPKLMGVKGSVDPKMITSEPGQFIPVLPGAEFPRPLELPQAPQYVVEMESRLHNDLDDIAGQHEISRGTNPSQVTAATALSYLQEQDDTKLAYAVGSIESAISQLGRHYLNLVTQFWTTPRMVKCVGLDGLFEVQNWKASDLRGNTDVRVEAGSSMPTSKAAKQAFIMELFKYGVFPPERLLEMMDLHGAEKIYEETLIDKRQAQRENLKMAALTPEQVRTAQSIQDATGITRDTPILRVNDWDNHQLHIYFHNMFRKSQQFDLLPQEVKDVFEAHVVLHRRALMEGTIPASDVAAHQIQASQEAGQAPPGQEGGPVEPIEPREPMEAAPAPSSNGNAPSEYAA